MRPPSATTEAVAPERHREAGNRLTRTLRDEIARRFMAEFGMTGATAVRFAKAMLADIKDERDAERMAGMSRADLARFIAEQPHNLHRARKVTPRKWREVAS